MKTETVAEFLARGGTITKSTKKTTLDELLYTEGMLDHQDADNVKSNLSDALAKGLEQELQNKE